MSLSDQNPSHEKWEQMDVTSLRKFVREDLPSSPGKESGAEESFGSLYKKEKRPEDAFRSFQDVSTPIPVAEPLEERLSPALGETEAAAQASRPPEPVAEEPVVPPDFTAEREAAKAEGFSAGHAEGHAAGFAEGLAEGQAEGAAKGYDAGFAEGREAGVAELAATAKDLESLVDGIRNQWPELLRRYEQEIVGLSIQIAEKVVFGSLAVDTEVVSRAILSALRALPDPMEVTVAVSPEDFQQVEMLRERFFQEVPELRQMQMASDPGIGRGGCRVTAATGSIREEVDRRLAVLQDTLVQAAQTQE